MTGSPTATVHAAMRGWRAWLQRVRPTPLQWAAWRFQPQRADFYAYLADLSQATQGRRTLKQILQADAARHGSRRARGLLCAHWARRLEDTGELSASLAGTLPMHDVALIALLQRAGATALADGLRDLAALVRLDQKMRRLLLATLAAGLAALLIAMLTWAAVPLYTVPELRAAFPDLSHLPQPPLTRRLFALSDWLQRHSGLAALFALMPPVLLFLALPRWRGPLRQRCDRLPVLRLWRDLHAIRLLVCLAVLLRPRGTRGIGLREALQLLGDAASPWLRHHLDQMARHLDDARIGAQTFHTGLLDDATYAYLEDLTEALGLDGALQHTRTRLEQATLRSVEQRAQGLRWALMLAAIAALVGLMLWHYGVIQEMRALMLMDQ